MPDTRWNPHPVRRYPRGDARVLTRSAAPAPARVPTKVIPPSVPAGTPSKVVIRWALLAICLSTFAGNRIRGGFRQRCGHRRQKVRLPLQANIAAQTVAIPRFARTCEAVLPSPRSAVPSSSLRARPIRVANHVTANREKSAANAPGPAQATGRSKRCTSDRSGARHPPNHLSNACKSHRNHQNEAKTKRCSRPCTGRSQR